ncbi:MFS transporter [Salinibacterium hongtaonis]|nr:MFS transporter [Salinibacterium hongtaonis]
MNSISNDILAGGLTRRQATTWRNGIFMLFGVSGLALASWLARTPAVKQALDLSTSDMGLLLFGIAIGSLCGLLLSSHLIAHFGARSVMLASLIALAVGQVVTGFAITGTPSFALAFAGLCLLGAGLGTCDVGMNLSGAVTERVLGRTIMPVFHAFFSIGTILGALLAAGAELLNISLLAQNIAVGIAVVVIGGAGVRMTQSEHILETPSESGEAPARSTWRERLLVWRNPRILAIGVIVLGMALAEGAANDWLTLAVVQEHGVANETGALIFGVFVTAMTAGRLAGVRVIDRFGRVPVLRACAVLAVIGLSLVILVPILWIVIVGVVLWGLGASLGFPTGMSAAADDPRTAAASVSAVATMGYLAFLAGPPMIGFVGEQIGLLGALGLVLVLIIIAGFASPAAREPQEQRMSR